jgi:hypothetical protein
MGSGMMMDEKMMGERWTGHGMMSCCGSPVGIIHFLGGAGVALLAVSYFNIPDVMFWGWVLVVAAIVGHLWKMMMWKKIM